MQRGLLVFGWRWKSLLFFYFYFSKTRFLDPLVSGNYPVGLRNVVGSRLPLFTEEQSQKIRGSMDFIGVNHYFTMYCFDVPRKSAAMSRDYLQDMSIGMAGMKLKLTNRFESVILVFNNVSTWPL